MNTRQRAAWGRRSGVTAGLLGILAVLGELCFLLPDVLVTQEARPFYREHMAVFRGILLATLLATFVLAAAGLLLLRSKTYGMLGMGLGLVAMAMGGAEVEPVQLGSRTFFVGLDYFVLELLVLGLFFIPLERKFLLHRQNIFRTGWQTDLKHFFLSHSGVQLLSFATMIPVQALFAWTLTLPMQEVIRAQPLWLQFIEVLLVVDLADYWVHRAFHRIPALWNFHAIHHSSRQMDWLAGSRMHVVDILVTRAAAFAPVFVLGFSPAAVYAYLAFVSFHAVFIHANVRWRWKRLRWIIATPEFHHWHHTSDEEGIDKNFSVLLPLWDVIFGTAHMPGHWPKKYGTVKFQPPETWLGQLAYPFRRRRNATPYG
jgi:sterol desaturase/sphingolipid hydroxylase (fatty acid hydroxylase superfamily)